MNKHINNKILKCSAVKEIKHEDLTGVVDGLPERGDQRSDPLRAAYGASTHVRKEGSQGCI